MGIRRCAGVAIAPAITALILCILQVEAAPFVNVPVALKLQSSISLVKIPPYYITVPRGGAEDSDDDSSEDDSDSESEAEENGEEEEKYALDAKLVASTLKKNAQIKAKTSKEAVNVKLALPKKKKKMKLFRLPYIVRACLNPFTVMKMTVAYWKSLIDFNYGKEDASQELRSALQTKAKTQGGGGSKRPGAKKRGGRVKTLSDLPRLNT